MNDYLILYTSKTGNTQKLASQIFSALPGTAKDFYEFSERPQTATANTYFIGFWTDRGTAPMEILDYLSELHGVNIALFGTCGMGSNPEYYQSILKKVSAFIPEDSTYLGGFLCQGKMPMSIRSKYESLHKTQNNHQTELLLHNFDEALLHPNEEDYKKARDFASGVATFSS